MRNLFSTFTRRNQVEDLAVDRAVELQIIEPIQAWSENPEPEPGCSNSQPPEPEPGYSNRQPPKAEPRCSNSKFPEIEIN